MIVHISIITSTQLRRAADIKDQIDSLNKELDGIFGVPELEINRELEPKRTWTSKWTPERRAKFKRTMRRKYGH